MGAGALSEVAQNDSRWHLSQESWHVINTYINNSTIISDNLEKIAHTGTLLFPPPLSSFFFFYFISHSFLQGIKKTLKMGSMLLDSILKPSQHRRKVHSVSHVFFFKSISSSIINSWNVSESPPDVSPPHSSIFHLCLLQDLAAHLAAADSEALLASLQRLLVWREGKLIIGIHGCQPEAVFIGKVVAGAPSAVALDERSRPEVLQTGAGRHQGLTAALSASCCVH